MQLRTLVFTASLLALLVTHPGAAFAAPEVFNLWLVNAATNTRIRILENYDTVTLPTSPSELSIEAEANGETQSMVMRINNVISSTENLSPYSLVGDDSGNFHPATQLRTPGWITVSARPYASDDAAGVAGAQVSLSLYIYQPDFFVTSALDLGDINPGDGRCAAARQFIFSPGIFGALPQVSGVLAAQDRIDIVDRLALRGPCTLRAAIEESNALAGNQSILVDGTKGPFLLSKGQLEITQGVTINGHQMPIVDGQLQSRIFLINGQGHNIIVNLNDLDLRRGSPGSFDRGGAIQITDDALAQISRCVIRESSANFGGGIYLQAGGDLTMWDSAVHDNEAGDPSGFGGGGITQRGGGIFNLEGNVQIIRSSIFDNAAVRGGGLSNFGGTMRVENSSVIDNEAASIGGGIENRDNGGKTGNLHLSFATVAFNQAGTSAADPATQRRGGGIHNTGWAYMASSIVAENGDPFSASDVNHAPDCYSPTLYDFKSFRNNVVGVLNSNCSLTDYSWGNDAWITYGSAAAPLDPGFTFRLMWGELANYNLLQTSVAVDGGATQSASLYPCPDTDMRSRTRPVGGGCDIGAVERQ